MMVAGQCTLLIVVLAGSEAFVPIGGGGLVRHTTGTPTHYDSPHRRRRTFCTRCHMTSRDGFDEGKAKPTSENPNMGIKAAWYGSEVFGNIIGMGKTKPSEEDSPDGGSKPQAISRKDAVARLKTDFDRFYFVTGKMDLDLYEEDCTFADPFVAFQGRQRFKNNLDNLGSLMQDVNLDVTGWEEAENSITTKWRFRCVLGLPWKPSLAAAGGTEFIFNKSSGRIERHIESWEIEPLDALKQLIRPGRKQRNK